MKLLVIWGLTIALLFAGKKLYDYLQVKSDPFDQLRALYARKLCPCDELIEIVFSYEQDMKLHKKQNKRLKDVKQKDVYEKIYEEIFLNVEVLNTYILHYDEEADKERIRETVMAIRKLIDQLRELDNLYLILESKARVGDPKEVDYLIEALKEMAEV